MNYLDWKKLVREENYSGKELIKSVMDAIDYGFESNKNKSKGIKTLDKNEILGLVLKSLKKKE